MIAPGAPRTDTIRIDSKTYYLKKDSEGRPIHQTVAIGRELREYFDFRQPSGGMGATVRQGPQDDRDYFTDNMDNTGRGLRLSPKVNTISITAAPLDRVGFFWEVEHTSGDPRLYYYVAISTTTVRVYKFNPATDALITGTSQPFDIVIDGSPVNVNAGRPETFDGKPYICIGIEADTDTEAFQQLTTVVTTANADTWTVHDTAVAVDMLLVSEALDGRSQLIRATNINKLQLCAGDASGDGPLDEANWAPTDGGGHDVGTFAPHRVCLGGANAGGIVYISKAEGLFTFDNTGNSWPVIREQPINTDRPRHGVLCFAFGNIVFWGHASGLYRVLGLTGHKLCGPDAIEGYEDVPNITAPRKFQHYSGTYKGEWLYFDYRDDTNDNNSYILACKLAPPGSDHPLEIHTLIKRTNQIHGLYVDSQDKLRWVESHASTPVVGWIQLAPDGSPTGSVRGTATTATYEWYGPEIDFGEPEIAKQLRYAFVEMEDGAASVSWQLKAHLDSATAVNVGSAITTAAASNLNPTVGTDDSFRKLRPRFTVTGTGDHDDVDPKALGLILYARTADTMRVVLTTENPGEQKKRVEIAKILRKLKNAGPKTFREPHTNETFTGYVKAVNEVSDGIEVIYDRWQVNA